MGILATVAVTTAIGTALYKWYTREDTKVPEKMSYADAVRKGR